MRRHLLFLALVLTVTTSEATRAFARCLSCGPDPVSSILYGFITQNTTLTYASPGPTYEMLGDLIIMPNVTLTIEPGVTLRVAANHDTLEGGRYTGLAELIVRGTLTADGSEGDSIRVIPSQDGTAQWGGVYIESGGTAYIKRVVLSGGLNGIDAVQGAGTLRESTILGSSTGSSVSSGTGLLCGRWFLTTASDTTAAHPTVIAHFTTGSQLADLAVLRNVIVRNCVTGIVGGSASMASYCTSVWNTLGFGGTNALNCIAAYNNTGLQNGDCDYTDSWGNNTNYAAIGRGQWTASFDPFFVDPSSGDYRLQPTSAFKHFSNSGGEIGAYGPTCGSSAATMASESPSQMTMTATPNPARGPVLLTLGTGRGPVRVCDVSGRVVRSFLDAAGSVHWDGRNESGTLVPNGMYFWSLRGSPGFGRVMVVR